jgi:multicomponent Na+:H+ antiporter subunit B
LRRMIKAYKAQSRMMRFYRISAALIATALIGVLLYTVGMLPEYGADNTPMENEVVERYIEKGVEETGAINLVAGMILDYRAFDTFGESCVLFVAVMSVVLLLQRDKNNLDQQSEREIREDQLFIRLENNEILRLSCKIALPVLFLFGLYVVLNGHLSLGGGFSGGTLMGGGLILYSLAYGYERAHAMFSARTFTRITCACLLVYCLAKGYAFFTGANGLENHIPLGAPGAILSAGLILPLNICVGFIVACTVYGFYALFMRGEI